MQLTHIVKRNGKLEVYKKNKILQAIESAFNAKRNRLFKKNFKFIS